MHKIIIIYAVINEASHWDEKTSLSPEALGKLVFLVYSSFDKFNGYPMWPSSPIVNVISYSDGSDVAWQVWIQLKCD